MIIESQDDVTRAVLIADYRALADGSYAVEFSFMIEPGETRRPKAPISAKVAA
jgi:hypothetical protein